MRVLTDPMEIKNFRKRQIKKIGRMTVQSIHSGARNFGAVVRKSVINFSLMLGFFALWLALLAVMLFAYNYILECALVY